MDPFKIIERIDAFAQANGVLPQTVVRKINGDPRGYARLKRKLSDIAEIKRWLDERQPENTEGEAP